MRPPSAIDAFRGIAALTVAAYHTREITWVGVRDLWHTHGLTGSPGEILGYLTFPLVWGGIGVPVFFVLSGYCIHRSQAFARALTGSYNLSTVNFLARRFFRIYPVLFGALLVTCTCDYAGRYYAPNAYHDADNSALAFLINLASLQGVAGPTYGTNGALWTLSLEVQFYLLYPLLLVVMSRFGRAAALQFLIGLGVVSYFVLERPGYTLFSSYYVSWYLGVMVADNEAAGSDASRLHVGFYLSSSLLLTAGCVLYFSNPYGASQVWAVAFALFLYEFLRSKAEINGRFASVLCWLGGFSFSLYIIHVPVVVLIDAVLFGGQRQASLIPCAVILAATVACAYAFSAVFEQPALALSKAWKRRK